MLECRREHDLALEPVDGDRGGELVGQDFDDDEPAEGVIASDEDGRHAATRELSLEGEGVAEGTLELVS
jgi:hypothetical protein